MKFRNIVFKDPEGSIFEKTPKNLLLDWTIGRMRSTSENSNFTEAKT